MAGGTFTDCGGAGVYTGENCDTGGAAPPVLSNVDQVTFAYGGKLTTPGFFPIAGGISIDMESPALGPASEYALPITSRLMSFAWHTLLADATTEIKILAGGLAVDGFLLTPGATGVFADRPLVIASGVLVTALFVAGQFPSFSVLTMTFKA